MALFKGLKSIFKKPKSKPKAGEKIEVTEKPLKKPQLKKKYFKEAYRVLREPHISEKATLLNKENKYVFKIYSGANKVETKKAIESLYGVRVKDVNIVNVPRKRKVFRGIEGFKAGYKKAIVTLEEGYKIEILPH